MGKDEGSVRFSSTLTGKCFVGFLIAYEVKRSSYCLSVRYAINVT